MLCPVLEVVNYTHEVFEKPTELGHQAIPETKSSGLSFRAIRLAARHLAAYNREYLRKQQRTQWAGGEGRREDMAHTEKARRIAHGAPAGHRLSRQPCSNVFRWDLVRVRGNLSMARHCYETYSFMSPLAR